MELSLGRSRELQFMDQSTGEVFITIFQMLKKAEQRLCRLSRNAEDIKRPKSNF